MLIVKKVIKEKDGNYTSEWNLSDDQMNFLLTFAINSLVAQGLATINELGEDHYLLDTDDEAQLQREFLEDLDIEGMHKS